MTMTAAIETDGSKLSKRIILFAKAGEKLHHELHALSCSAVLLAVNHGRCDHLNQLMGVLPKLMQDGLRAWLNPQQVDPAGNKLWFGEDEIERKPWIKFTAKDNTFAIVKGVERPAAYVVESIAERFETSFLFKSAKSVVKDTTFEAEMIAMLTAVAKKSEAKAKNDQRAAPYAQQAAEMLAKAIKQFGQPAAAPVLMIEHKAA